MADSQLRITQRGKHFCVETTMPGASRPIEYGKFVDLASAERALPRYAERCRLDHLRDEALMESIRATQEQLRSQGE